MQTISGNNLLPLALIPNNSSSPGGLESEDLSVRQVIRVLRKRKYIVLLITLACCLLAIGISFLMTPYYKSEAMIEIQKTQNDVGDLGALASALTDDDDVKTEIQTSVSILQSDSLALETIERMHFEEHEDSAKSVWGSRKRIPAEKGLPLRDAPVAREYLLKKFEKRLSIEPLLDTRIVEVDFKDPDANYAAKTTNALIEQYIKDNLARRNSATVQASQWMEGEISDLQARVQTSQQRLIDFEKQSGIIIMPSTSGSTQSGGASSAATQQVSLSSPVLNRLTQLNQDLVIAETTLVAREAINQVAKSGDVDALATMAVQMQSSDPGGAAQQSDTFAELSSLRQQKGSLKVQMAASLNTFGPKNPRLADLAAQIHELDDQIAEELRRIVIRTNLDVQLAKDNEAGVRKAYLAEEKEAFKMNDAQIHLAVLQQEADSTRALYQDLYTKLGESKLSQGTQRSNTAIISAALPPADPASPIILLNAAVGIAAGLIIGAFSAFIRDSFDDSVTTGSQVEVLTGIPVLGSIPTFDKSPSALRSRSKQARVQMPLATYRPQQNWWLTHTDSQAAEAYRTLRTTLLLSRPGAPPRSVLMTSSLPYEGKTTTVYNLASCFALNGTRVLAIDGDLRKPSLHKSLGISNKSGLSNLLTSNLNLNDIVVKDPNIENLSILASGPVPPNPAELLGSAAFGNLINTAEGQYDLVIVDSPPCMVVTDAMLMARSVEGVMVLVRSGVTTRPVLVRSAENLRRSKANLLGFVLNAVDTKSAEYYYANGFYGGNYYEKSKS